MSIDIAGGKAMFDLCYAKDSRAEVDFNGVMTGEGKFKMQGTAEGEPFARESMNRLIDLARDGIGELMRIQNQILK